LKNNIEIMRKDLVDISRFYGADPEYVIAGGGNTSFKDDSKIWVKASGIALETIDEKGFVCLSREKLKVIEEKKYSSDAVIREQEVKNDLAAAIINSALRPSVETSLHNIIDYAYVVHTHPTKLNALLCSNSAKTLTHKLFGNEALFIEYTDPGYILFKKVLGEIESFKKTNKFCPRLIFLENHGVFVAADSVAEIHGLYKQIMQKVKPAENIDFNSTPLQNEKLREIAALPQFRKRTVLAFTGELIRQFTANENSFSKINTPFTPDHIVYCKSKYLFQESSDDLKSLSESITGFENQNGYLPKVIAISDFGLITIDDNLKSAQTVFDVFFDMMKISRLSEFFGGPKFMTTDQIEFIDNWEVENYRRKVASK
jgi:rhamnose utilization protein RhaD (predicted bifunctional aldolase and dehydrogenase)